MRFLPHFVRELPPFFLSQKRYVVFPRFCWRNFMFSIEKQHLVHLSLYIVSQCDYRLNHNHFQLCLPKNFTWIYGINPSPRRIILAMHNLWLTVQVSKCYSFRGLFILNFLSKVQCFYHLKLVTDSKFRIKQRQETMILLTADPV